MASPIDLPAVDGLTSRWAVFETSRRRVDLSAALGQFLLTANLEGVVPLLVTPADASVSLHVNMEMMRCGGLWLTRSADGTLTDVLFGVRVADFDAACDRFALAKVREPAFTPDAAGYGALGFELMVHHRTTRQLRVGAIAADVIGEVAGVAPDCWGSTQPLNRAWDLGAITDTVRMQMPNSSYVRGSAPDGSRFVLHYERTNAGVSERIRGAIPLGPYGDSVGASVDASVRLLSMVERKYVVIAGMTSLCDLEPDLSATARLRRPEVPRALLIGPWGLRAGRVDVAAMQADFGAERLGRAAVPSLLFRFDSGAGKQPPWAQLAQIYAAIGYENVATAVGWEVPV